MSLRNLSPASLELAVWIARLGSFTAAAERLHTTQPAVSARVRELEEQVGHRLFVRQGRGVALTIEGREFVRKAELVLRQLEDLALSFGEAHMPGVVRLGTSSICLDLLAALTTTMARTMPKLAFEVEIDRAAPLLARLEARQLDLVLLTGPVDANRFTRRSLGVDRMLWVALPQLVEERWKRPAEERLSDVGIWCVDRRSYFWSEAMQRLSELGATPERVNAINHTLDIVRLVQAGAGIGFVAETLVRDALDRGTLVTLPGIAPSADIEFSVVCTRDTDSRLSNQVMEATVAVSPFRRQN